MDPCSLRGLPGWIERVRSELEKGNHDWILRSPGSPLMLRCLGYTSLQVPGAEPADLGCCGNRLATVNGGGLYTELEYNASLDQAYTLEPLTSPHPPMPCRETVQAVVSPLGWPSISPLVLGEGSSVAGCIELPGGVRLAPTGLEPLQAARTGAPCRRVKPRGDADLEAGVGVFTVEGAKYEGGLHGFSLYTAGNGLRLLSWKDGLLALGRGTLVLGHPYRYVTLGLLGPGRLFSVVVERAEARAVAAVVGGGLGSLALGSRSPFNLRVYPGRLEIEVEGSLRLAAGGGITAVRLMHEDQVLLTPVETCARGIGHLRSSNAVALVSSSSPSELVLAVYSPVGDGIVEARLYAPIRRAVVHEVMGSVEVPAGGDIIRVPAPWGCVCGVRVKIGSLMFRLRGRSRLRSP